MLGGAKGNGHSTLTSDLPLSHGKKNPVYAVMVEGPDGTRLQAEAELRLDHFRPGGYKLIAYLPRLDKADVPVISKVWKV
ncbi:TPA: hypothetical protein UOJ00_003255 [Stenotrophomonas maltophilia]|jgi:hypothetical protein|uniref:hypothetical protein n=1 Tax=Stenotrophomonas TaxID=40323 RepID=UPI0013130C3C|nr:MULTISPECIES: hypothetical protein [Stenotrophomonas]EKU9957751.1 hypothetical protein [Stenotrophomonas maltophilia]EKU9974386.1 hypothetical protein [Stenotrophomonas maltophilia]EKU9983859.1 hypothetical protein [Stenotrophomonas maltophilia]MBD3743209.1 hypothetical protein [Stenotrophomonas sp.]MBH1731609.1 hypothetical protein [Stenotrophomonas maltophilia]